MFKLAALYVLSSSCLPVCVEPMTIILQDVTYPCLLEYNHHKGGSSSLFHSLLAPRIGLRTEWVLKKYLKKNESDFE